MGKVWERPGRGHGSELFVFLVFPWFFAVWPKTSRTQKEKFRPMGKVWAIHTQTKKTKNQKTKKPRNQKTKKPKNQKKQKNQDCTPQGEGVRCRVLGLVFLFFLFFWFFGFLFFCFFGFLVCVWIAIADVPSRNCQALSVVALEVGQAKTKKPKNQKTKKPRNQKTKKPKKPKKPRLHTPRGGGQMQSVGSCLFGFFVFFVFFFGFLFFWFVCG